MIHYSYEHLYNQIWISWFCDIDHFIMNIILNNIKRIWICIQVILLLIEFNQILCVHYFDIILDIIMKQSN